MNASTNPPAASHHLAHGARSNGVPSRRAAALTRHATDRWAMLVRDVGPCVAGQTVMMLAFTDDDHAITVTVVGQDRDQIEHHLTVPLAALALPSVPEECFARRSWYCVTAATGDRPDLHDLCDGHTDTGDRHPHVGAHIGRERCECDAPDCRCHLRHGQPTAVPRPRALTGPAGPAAEGTPRVIDDGTDLGAHDYRLERIYRIDGATVRVRICRNVYASQSHAIAEVLTPEHTWTHLLTEGPHRWHRASPLCREVHTITDVLSALDPIAQRLAARAATTLTT